MPTKEVKNIEIIMVRTKIIQPGSAKEPMAVNAVNPVTTPKPIYAPTMKISP